MTIFKPMLAATLDNLEDVKLPCYVQPKLDGIRCLIVDGIAVSRNLKPIPNKYIQERLKGLSGGLDGELMVHKKDFNGTQSAVMSEEGEPDFCYYIFDWVDSPNFKTRIQDIEKFLLRNHQPIKVVSTIEVKTVDALRVFENAAIVDGYEGIIIRSPDSPYKYGRSTVKEGYLLKYKRFKDSEGYIIGFEELNKNTNEKTKDALGHSKRSSHKVGYIPAATLGAIIIHDPVLNIEVTIGTGFDKELRDDIWNNQRTYIGNTVTYGYQELSAKGQPRFPSFRGFRPDGA
jgi:DNA ligase-1